MSKLIHNSSRSSRATGFTLLELLVAMTLSLLLVGLVFTVAQNLNNTADFVGSMSDVNENLRAAMNMLSRDLCQAGENIPSTGLPIPSGTGAVAIKRPGPGTLTFAGTVMSALTPGNGLGPTQGSGANQIQTDIVTMIGVNQFSPFNNTSVIANPTVSATQGTITVSTTAAGNVSPGQLVMLTNAIGSCLLAVSSVNTGTGVITFKNGDTTNDPLGVNQFLNGAGNTGTLYQLQTTPPTGPWLPMTAYPIYMTTYYLDTSSPRRLMKQIIMGTAQPAALGINVMTISYSCSPLATPTDPTRNPASPNSIRKVILTMIAQTDHQNHANGQWYSKSVTNAVAVQNLDYSNKYSLGASMTQN